MKDVRALIGKLNLVCMQALERALGRCVQHQHFSVEIEHLLLALLEAKHSDLARACAAEGLAANRLEKQLVETLEGFQRGNDKVPFIANSLLTLLSASWIVASQEMGHATIRSGAILQALLDCRSIGVSNLELAPAFTLIRDGLRRNLPDIMRGGMEVGPEGSSIIVGDALDPALLPRIAGLDPQADNVFRRDAQPVWTDSVTGSRRRAISPAMSGPLQLIEVSLPAGASLITPAAVGKFLYQQIWLISGTLHLTVGAAEYVLTSGDCFVFGPPAERIFSNRGTEDCRYLLAQGRRGGKSSNQPAGR